MGTISHFEALEVESIYIMRETTAQAERPEPLEQAVERIVQLLLGSQREIGRVFV